MRRPVRNHLKTDVPFPNREARTLPRREPGRSLTSENLAGDLPSAPEPGSERGPRILARGVFRLALSVVEEEADHGRTSCASLGGLESPFRGARSRSTQSHCFHSAQRRMHSAPDVTFKMHKRNTGFQQTESCLHSALMEWSLQAISTGFN